MFRITNPLHIKQNFLKQVNFVYEYFKIFFLLRLPVSNIRNTRTPRIAPNIFVANMYTNDTRLTLPSAFGSSAAVPEIEILRSVGMQTPFLTGELGHDMDLATQS